MVEQRIYSHKGVEAESLEKLCRYFNIDISRVISYQESYRCSLENAMDFGMRHLREPILFQDKEYLSLGEMCTVSNIDYDLLYHVLYFFENENWYINSVNKFNIDIEEAYDFLMSRYDQIKKHYESLPVGDYSTSEHSGVMKSFKNIKTKNQMLKRKYVYEYKGVSETNFEVFCTKLNRGVQKVRSFIAKGCSLEEAIEKSPEVKPILPVEYRGVTYSNLNQLCLKFGIRRQTLSKMLDEGYNLNDAVEIVRKRKKVHRLVPVTYKNETYKSLRFLCLSLKVNRRSVDKLLNEGHSLDSAIDIVISRKNSKIRKEEVFT